MSMTFGPGRACVACGNEISGKQRYWCSERCRGRFRTGALDRVRSCRFCGAILERTNPGRACRMGSPLMPDHPGYSVRDEALDDNADAFLGDECWNAQCEEEQRKADAREARDFPTCAHCGKETEYMGGEGVGGRHRKFCSATCRVYAHRARKRKARTPQNTA